MKQKRVSAAEYRKIAKTKVKKHPRTAQVHIYKTIPMKSSWEVRYAAYLDTLKRANVIKDWFYEPIRFNLGFRTSYTPDFRVLSMDERNYFIEMKGYLREPGRVKFRASVKQNPYDRFIMVSYDKDRLYMIANSHMHEDDPLLGALAGAVL